MGYLSIRRDKNSPISDLVVIRIHIDYKKTLKLLNGDEKTIELAPGEHQLILESGLRHDKISTKILSVHPIFPLMAGNPPYRKTITIKENENESYEIQKTSHRLKDKLFILGIISGMLIFFLPVALYGAFNILQLTFSPFLNFLIFLLYALVLFGVMLILLRPLRPRLDKIEKNPPFTLKKIS